MVLLYVLLERSDGYALCAVREVEDLDMLLPVVVQFRQNVDIFTSTVKLVAYSPFKSAEIALENVNAIHKGVLHEDLKLFLETNFPAERQKILLGVSHSKIADAIQEELNIGCQMGVVVAQLMKGIWLYFDVLMNRFAIESDSKAKLDSSHGNSRAKVNDDQEDKLIIESIILLDQLSKDINTFSMKVRERYGRHFPELIKIVPDNYNYCRMVKVIRDRKELSEEKLQEMEEIVKDGAKAQEILHAARSSVGNDIRPIDFTIVENYSDRLISSSEKWNGVHESLRSKMSQVAPSLCALVGEMVGARLIARAGSLRDLAKLPSSKIQVLGAKKSLSRNRYSRELGGLVFHSSLITRVPAKEKVRLSRCLAAQCALAVRMDYTSENPSPVFGEKLREQVEQKVAFCKAEEASRKNLDVTKTVQKKASNVTAETTKTITAETSKTNKKKERWRNYQKKKRLEGKLRRKKKMEKKQETTRLEMMVTEEDNEPSPDTSRDEEGEPSVKKKKKRKSEGEVSEIMEEQAQPKRKRKKKKKKKSAPEECPDSEVAAEITQEPEKKDLMEIEEEKRLQAMVTEEDNEPEDRDEVEKPSKKKRKRKSKGIFSENGIEEEEEQTPSKRKIKKSAPEEPTGSEVTEEIKRKLKKEQKKKKREARMLQMMVTEEDNEPEDSEPSPDRGRDEEEELSIKKKKKKKCKVRQQEEEDQAEVEASVHKD